MGPNVSDGVEREMARVLYDAHLAWDVFRKTYNGVVNTSVYCDFLAGKLYEAGFRKGN